MERNLTILIVVVVLLAVGFLFLRLALPVIMVNQLVEKYADEAPITCAINTNYIITNCIVDGSTMSLELVNMGATPLYGFSVIFDGILKKIEFNQDKLTTEPEITQANPLVKGSTAYLIVDISDGPDFSNPYNIRVFNEACKSASSRISNCEVY